MLELRQLTKTYAGGVRAVDQVTLTLERGVVGLVGHNGAGKTSLMQMIATLTRPSGGELLFHGRDIVRRPQLMRARLGFLPQDFGVYPNLSALEFMQYVAALKGVADPARIVRLLELVNLQAHARRPAATFSGGMRRRLGIAQALLNDPEILVVDEPTAGLDPEERLRFRQLLSELAFDKLVLLSTHIVSDVESIAGRLAVMHGGRVISFGTPAEIVARARGLVWSAEVGVDDYQALRARVRVLQAQRDGERVSLRMAHRQAPCAGALAAEPSLEEALMAQQDALPEPA